MADNGETRPTGISAIKNFLLANKHDTMLGLIRLYISVSTFCYLIPVVGLEFSNACYRRVLVGNAALSALRLHQRLPRFQFNMEFFRQLLTEDSFHYLCYSIIFLMGNGGTMVLFPITCFAFLHATTYMRKVLEVSGSNSGLALKLRQLCSKIENRETQTQLLQFIAVTEIMIFPATILLLFSGQTIIVVPFIYYRFLQLRYTSRRNPYTRLMFSQLRLMLDRLALHAACPAIIARLIRGFVSLVSRLAPVQEASST